MVLDQRVPEVVNGLRGFRPHGYERCGLEGQYLLQEVAGSRPCNVGLREVHGFQAPFESLYETRPNGRFHGHKDAAGWVTERFR